MVSRNRPWEHDHVHSIFWLTGCGQFATALPLPHLLGQRRFALVGPANLPEKGIEKKTRRLDASVKRDMLININF